MNLPARITSILRASYLDASITGLPSFDLADLDLSTDLEFQLPTNLRLGHLAERVVANLIKSSTNYQLLFENIQLIKDQKTIGEIDFIIENKNTKEVTHLELAYKFYLFDPSISSTLLNNWIGPNRNDSLKEKLEKLKEKQFPLLYHEMAKTIFHPINLDEVSQALCLLVSLFIPYEYKGSFSPIYKKAIKGYYLNIASFINFDHSKKTYHLPPKKEWGIDPADNHTWSDFKEIEAELSIRIKDRKAPLCWQKHKEAYLAFFIVWW